MSFIGTRLWRIVPLQRSYAFSLQSHINSVKIQVSKFYMET